MRVSRERDAQFQRSDEARQGTAMDRERGPDHGDQPTRGRLPVTVRPLRTPPSQGDVHVALAAWGGAAQDVRIQGLPEARVTSPTMRAGLGRSCIVFREQLRGPLVACANCGYYVHPQCAAGVIMDPTASTASPQLRAAEVRRPRRARRLQTAGLQDWTGPGAAAPRGDGPRLQDSRTGLARWS